MHWLQIVLLGNRMGKGAISKHFRLVWSTRHSLNANPTTQFYLNWAWFYSGGCLSLLSLNQVSCMTSSPTRSVLRVSTCNLQATHLMTCHSCGKFRRITAITNGMAARSWDTLVDSLGNALHGKGRDISVWSPSPFQNATAATCLVSLSSMVAKLLFRTVWTLASGRRSFNKFVFHKPRPLLSLPFKQSTRKYTC